MTNDPVIMQSTGPDCPDGVLRRYNCRTGIVVRDLGSPCMSAILHGLSSYWIINQDPVKWDPTMKKMKD
jgi:hypothetical protein